MAAAPPFAVEGHDVMADDEVPMFPEDAPSDADGRPIVRP